MVGITHLRTMVGITHLRTMVGVCTLGTLVGVCTLGTLVGILPPAHGGYTPPCPWWVYTLPLLYTPCTTLGIHQAHLPGMTELATGTPVPVAR